MLIFNEFRKLSHCVIRNHRKASSWSQNISSKLLTVSNAFKNEKIRQIGDPFLRNQAKSVEMAFFIATEFQEIIDTMTSILRKSDTHGISAPQVGYSLQIIAYEVTGKDIKDAMKLYGSKGVSEMEMSLSPLKILINPEMEIVDTSIVKFNESCLSMEGYTCVVPRARQIKVNALSTDGEKLTFLAHGWSARIIQHEMDHLRGNLIVDSMTHKSLTNTDWRNFKE